MKGAWVKAALVAAISVLTLALYRPVLNHEFVGYDDDLYVYENRQVMSGLNADSIRWALGAFETGNWIPVTWLSHMLDVEVHGLDPRGHHLTNAVLHAAVASLLFLVLASMTGAIWLPVMVAALFAVHPLQVESVAWVAERKNVLSTFFWMLTLLAYQRFTRKPSARGYAAVAAFFALGLMSKAMLVTVPVVLIILDWWPLGRIAGKRNRHGKPVPGSAGESPRAGNAPWRLIAEKLPFLAISIAAGVVAIAAQHRADAVSSLDVVPAGARVAQAFISSLSYIRMALWPSDLAVFYPAVTAVRVLLPAAACVALGAITIVCVAVARKRPWLLAGWLWFLVTLAPVIGIVQVGAQSMADRYAYVPVIGLLLMAVWGLREACGRMGNRGAILGVVSAAAILVFALVSRNQLSYWKDGEALFSRAIRVTKGNFVAYNNLGNVYVRRGQPDAAAAFYLETLKFRPNSPEARYNIGFVKAQAGRLEEAAAWFRDAIRADPSYQRAYYNLGFVLEGLGRTLEAEEQYRRALSLDPGDADSWNNLGRILLERGSSGEAGGYFEKALMLRPALPEALANQGDVLLQEGRSDLAAARYREALRLRPGYEYALRRLNAVTGHPEGEAGQ